MKTRIFDIRAQFPHPRKRDRAVREFSKKKKKRRLRPRHGRREESYKEKVMPEGERGAGVFSRTAEKEKPSSF